MCIIYRFTDYFGLEGTLRGYLVQAPCHEQGRLQLGQAAQGHIKSDPECLKGETFTQIMGD